MGKIKIGFIGQGWIGKNYADNFEERGYEVVRYDVEKFKDNKDKLKDCRIVFAAVPTPTDKNGFNDNILIDAVKTATFPGQTIIIKSTIKLGTTDKMQEMFPDRYFIHSPEFLTEKTAAHDAANPARNILGYTAKSFSRCGEVMNVLPAAPYEENVPCREAEMVKYMGNCWFYAKVMMMNAFYDIASHHELDFDRLKDMLGADKRVGRTHLDVVHQGGRGAGGHCFIKDFAALKEMYQEMSRKGDARESINTCMEMLSKMEVYNISLLKETGKCLDLLEGVYGTDINANQQIAYNNKTDHHESLKVKMHDYAKGVYAVTRSFPEDELSRIVSRLRRASLSVVLNYIRGVELGRGKNINIYGNFLEKSYRSLKESEYLLHFSYTENYFSQKDYLKLSAMAEELGKTILNLLKNLSNSANS